MEISWEKDIMSIATVKNWETTLHEGYQSYDNLEQATYYQSRHMTCDLTLNLIWGRYSGDVPVSFVWFSGSQGNALTNRRYEEKKRELGELFEFYQKHQLILKWPTIIEPVSVTNESDLSLYYSGCSIKIYFDQGYVPHDPILGRLIIMPESLNR